ncbi:molybdopterin cofactor-binding domain-containing protein [Paracoccus sanguinis]|uniref:Isoquinoline 1-oxidoreductase, beta subunit n=1 Tax=Paracoccus sanguinis TaxID=1545044 RepID=A0A1H3CK47_9RHOB|nr:molybdopterin cofactor-binding domain-containing protein [Paracoccus sanguinis]KGJ16556.1 hypothetical protein IX57_11875 [Paracoccus sanguinis]SDX54531.1 isoquinoline 1-oxidoreductase, beta subunit [Paracoccus sanguinis]
MSQRLRLSRRAFVALSGGAAVAVASGGATWALWPQTVLNGRVINAYVALAPDGAVEVVCPALDIGQGAPDALAMILAEEIGASLARLRVIAAPRDAARYGNPDFAGRMVTADSQTTKGYWPILRLAGAEARAAFVATAARLRGWAVTECDAEAHNVIHRPSGATLDFAEIATSGRLSLPRGASRALRDPAGFRIVGSSPEDRNANDIVTGRKRFGTDLRAADTLVAVLRRSAHLEGAPREINDSLALAVPGVVAVVPLADAVAVAATDTWAAIRGAEALEVDWTPAGDFDGAAHERRLTAALDDPSQARVALRSVGAVEPSAAAGAAALFHAPALTHVLPEPLNATARPTAMGLGVAVEASTQSLDLDMRFAAQTWKTAPVMVETMGHPSGGAYGRRVLNDVVIDACAVAKALGRPVQVIRPLRDEMQRGQIRPAAVQRIHASLDGRGDLATWRHDIASDGTLSAQLPTSLKGPGGDEDNTATDGARHPYGVAAERITWTRVPATPTPGFLRGVSAAYTIWAIEVTVERLARGSGQDPLAWRLRHMADARLRAVVARAGAMAGWGAAGRSLGLAAMIFREARVATVAEVAGEDVVGLWVAADVGQVVHRDRVLRQIEGGVLLGLSMALHEELTFRNGAAAVESLADYPILTNGALPPFEIHLEGAPGLSPAGVGEVGVPTTVAAVANAFEALSGRQFDRLPLRL